MTEEQIEAIDRAKRHEILKDLSIAELEDYIACLDYINTGVQSGEYVPLRTDTISQSVQIALVAVLRHAGWKLAHQEDLGNVMVLKLTLDNRP